MTQTTKSITILMADDDDEEAPEVVSLYGSVFEGDGFVFVGGPTT